MTRAIFAGARRFAMILCAAALALPAAAAAQTSGSRPPISIPPAQIPPPSVSPGDIAPSAPTMRALLPSSVQIMHDSQGAGLVMYGALTGKAASALAVLQGVFTYSQAFDPIPALPLVLADEGDGHAQGLFTATIKGAPVTGIAVVSLSDKGGDISVFYDYAGSFAASFARLQQAFAESGSATLALSPIRLDDGSRIGVPAGWRVIGQGAGLVDLMGTQGEFVSLGVSTPVYARPTGLAGYVLQGQCCDPVAVLQAIYPQLAANAQHMGSPPQQIAQIVEAQKTPAPSGGQAAFILSNINVGGRAYSYFALVAAVAGFTDPWTFTLSGVTAPQPVFTEEFPVLLRIWQSHAADPQEFGERLTQALKGMSTAQRLARSTGRTRETNEYNASAAWNEAIPATAPAADKGGGQAQIGPAIAQKLADKLSADTGRPWRIVPAAELK